ncbi:MAG: metallophosphoesterase family protein [Candidatus Micrarchaeota archaeon]
MKTKPMIIGLLAISLFLFGCTEGDAAQDALRKGPYLIYPGDQSSMIVLFQTHGTPGSAVLEWGEGGYFELGKTELSEYGSGSDGHQFQHKITGLGPDRKINYRITIDGQEYESSFRTAPADDADSLTFYAYGDTRTNPGAQDAVLGQLLADMMQDQGRRQTIALHAGDYVTFGLDEAHWDDEFFSRKRPNIQEFLSVMPMMGAIGDHENFDNGEYVADVPDEGMLFRKYWPNPLFAEEGHFYYSFDYGPLHVTVIDQYTANYSNGSAQYDWIVDDIRGTDRPWKVVMFHQPGYSAYGIPGPNVYPHDDNEVVQQDLHPVFLENGVKVVVQGHNHYYARAEVDGIQYLTLGGGGAPLYLPDHNYPFVVAAAEDYHFSRMEIDGDKMLVSVINDEGDLIDWFSASAGDE